MARARPVVRDAVPDDAAALLCIWTDFTAEPPRLPQPPTGEDEVRRAVRRINDDPTQRLVVALAGDGAVGVAHLRRAPVSPIHDEDAVHVGYLHVLSKFRRRGLGKLMMETAAEWAEELGSQHIVASVAATARESNRFLARLGMSQVAVVRATSVASLKGMLRSSSAGNLSGPAVVPSVVTARRLMRLSASRGSTGR